MRSTVNYFLSISMTFMVCFLFCSHALALPNSSYFKDVTGDKKLTILAFGDSITKGVGDTVHVGGYPSRLSSILGTTVINDGRNGEVLATIGFTRLRSELRRYKPDLLIFNEGNSDAYEANVSIAAFKSVLSQTVQYVKRRNIHFVLATQYPELLSYRTVQGRLDQVNSAIRSIGAHTGIHVIDIDRAWKSTCDQLPACNLLYKDGLHPNSNGYDVITGVALATLDNIDVFKAGGAARVEKAYGLAKGFIRVKADH